MKKIALYICTNKPQERELTYFFFIINGTNLIEITLTSSSLFISPEICSYRVLLEFQCVQSQIIDMGVNDRHKYLNCLG